MPKSDQIDSDLIDYPGPDASDFLPGVCYAGWTARSALSRYLADEIDVWDYEEILDCLIEEWRNPTKNNHQVFDSGRLNALLSATTTEIPRSLTNPAGVTMMAGSFSPDRALSLWENPYPFEVIKDHFRGEYVYIKYKGLRTKMTQLAFNHLLENGEIMKHLERVTPSEKIGTERRDKCLKKLKV